MRARSLHPILAVAALVVATAAARPAQAQARRDSVVVSPAAPAPALGARPARQSWTSDRRNFMVGDLVIVKLDEFTLASATMRDDNSARRRTDADFGIELPGQAPGAAPAAKFGTERNTESRDRGDRSRQLRLQGELTARVMAIDPVTGALQIKGTKSVGVDKDVQTIAFAGSVRPQDLTGTNMIESSRVADARLDITNKGSLAKPKQGIIGKILGIVWP
ncbi:MAG: flagellar basal body L-ring protein FlgH [Gemmatimonadaceae bacterium]|nr:flagellar basal body L-ring protein FlgH [Gemmatimonadaceae bacterium]